MSAIEDYTNKPPIGVKPGWICAAERISALAGAIQRNADEGHGSSRCSLIRGWAEEILMQCDIWDKITEMDEKRFGHKNSEVV